MLLNAIVDEFEGEIVGMGEKQSWRILYPTKIMGNHTNICIVCISGKIQIGNLPNTDHMYMAQLPAA